MKILITSTNKAKVQATQKVFKNIFKDVEVIPLKVKTGVSNTPTTDEEGIQGALNRIKEAKRQDNTADFYVGLEGILSTNKYGSFICGWAVIESKKGNKAYGCSGRVQLPPFIAKHIKNFKELSSEVQRRYPSELVKDMSSIGSNGVITNCLYTRVDEFEDALMCAFGYISNKANY